MERVLSMVDAVLLVVDATEGPMSQTKVMRKRGFARITFSYVTFSSWGSYEREESDE